ncbi:MAG: hypothetical protein JRF59_16705 [Deltaproteobacteria bacterium]|nr:hypothetical protein [Deltaproteobacteria bacterium]MBW2008074.1 hypothetical protein [Deltaproteobacteria bacterium]MBW2104037.1 hypothetical protein [Deltaproteobacteria bacterium]MBW2349447.1 hypothetical protein [Deltaproteobacteria bacterium]
MFMREMTRRTLILALEKHALFGNVEFLQLKREDPKLSDFRVCRRCKASGSEGVLPVRRVSGNTADAVKSENPDGFSIWQKALYTILGMHPMGEPLKEVNFTPTEAYSNTITLLARLKTINLGACQTWFQQEVRRAKDPMEGTA